jgi:hypothetical protein
MVYASPDAIWPPNGKVVGVTMSITAADNVDPLPNCGLTAISGGAAGSTTIAGPFNAFVRADNGAVYVLTMTCTDSSGNASSASATVTVAKTNGNTTVPKVNNPAPTVPGAHGDDDDRDDHDRDAKGDRDDRDGGKKDGDDRTNKNNRGDKRGGGF